jgi:hypothetical protein
LLCLPSLRRFVHSGRDSLDGDLGDGFQRTEQRALMRLLALLARPAMLARSWCRDGEVEACAAFLGTPEPSWLVCMAERRAAWILARAERKSSTTLLASRP